MTSSSANSGGQTDGGCGPDQLDLAMQAAWPDGAPVHERALAARLSKTLREVVAKRLNTLLRWTSDSVEAPLNAREAAASAGLSKPRFYAMAAAWRASHSIAALGARAAEKKTRPARLEPAIRNAAMEVIREMLREDPDAGVTLAVRRMGAAGVPTMSYSMARRLWLEAKRDALPETFGARLLFDSVGLDVLTDEQRMRLFVVIDQGTDLVLGYARATNRSRVWGHVHAADHALEHLRSFDLTGFRAAAVAPSVAMTLQSDDVAGGGVLTRLLAEAGIPCEVSYSGLGRAGLRTLGERAGTVWLGVGLRDDRVSYRNGREARLPEYTEELHLAIETAIAAHNDKRRSMVVSPLVDETGHLELTRHAVRRVLEVVAAAGAELEALPLYSEAAMLGEL